VSATTTGAARTGQWPSRGLLLAVLAVSVVLNLFFIAGAAWTRIEAPRRAHTIEQRYARMANELDLNAQQRADFDRYVTAMRARIEKMQGKVSPVLGAAWEAAAKPQADAAEVQRLFDDAFHTRREFQHEAVSQTLDFLATLTPEQRRKFVHLARERRGPWRSTPARSR
jgi:Spy/CpxP family protein refolding chaperone